MAVCAIEVAFQVDEIEAVDVATARRDLQIMTATSGSGRVVVNCGSSIPMRCSA